MKRILSFIILIAVLSLLAKNSHAQSAVKQADEEYRLFNYEKAAELYLKAFKRDSTLYIASRLANSYRMMRDYENTELWYSRVVEMDRQNPEYALYYAEALRNNSKYVEAKAQFSRYYTLKRDFSRAQLKTLTAATDSAIRWLASPVPAEVENVRELNSEGSDWGAVRYNDLVVFTSDRENNTVQQIRKKKPLLYFDNGKDIDRKVYGWTGNAYLRLYQRAADDTVRIFPFSAGTDYHTGPASFTADGNQMYVVLTRTTAKKNKADSIETYKLEVYSSQKNASEANWSKQTGFRHNNNEKWSVGDPSITKGGDTLYFASDMPGGMGGTDIFYCVKDAAGNWGQPVNLKTVNSSGNERTPFVDAAGDLYFSSDTGIGMGGLDIFKASRTGADTYGPRQNLRYPFNSPRDDFAFVIYDNGTTGYFSSNRAGGFGSDDIYSFTQAPPLKLEGIAYDKTTRQPLAGTLVTLGKTAVRTDATGKYSFTVQPNATYPLRGEKATYLTESETVSTQGVIPPKTIRKDLYLDKIVLNKAIKIDNIYYDYDQSYIRPDAAIELNKIIKLLKDNPTIEIELGSHTDSRGNDDYNMALSRRRANAAVDYIITEGDIDEERITARGYGETRLLNRCSNGVKCSETEHQQNRRTEFTIVRYNGQ
ncbi:flagellar motor protein MotB [Mucilaginibacter limnophilus]|uniref:Flagellar motor protein MotB n=1 Tax=Mucilaginibacter limnophilus TaxID=1932778 RepID=A0A437MUP0_9SPHI|nr:OmpA family protein [Mucilaginibacter limnophilus]RVU01394.1 flagellar motor protein MotB [Mucilaginibacter limnophilus]